jgi:hypothetical protein
MPDMLGEAYRWIESDTGWYLQYHYGTAAYVKPDPDHGLFKVVIHWKGREIRGRAASLVQGRRHIERWINARGGRYEKRKAYEPSPQVKRWNEATDRAARLLLRRI